MLQRHTIAARYPLVPHRFLTPFVFMECMAKDPAPIIASGVPIQCSDGGKLTATKSRQKHHLPGSCQSRAAGRLGAAAAVATAAVAATAAEAGYAAVHAGEVVDGAVADLKYLQQQCKQCSCRD